MGFQIAFNRPAVGPREIAAIVESVRNRHISGNGPFCRQAEQQLMELHLGAPALTTSSCTSALEIAARLVSGSHGGEVILPSWTFVTTASAFVMAGMKPVYADIDPITLGLDLDSVEKKITTETRAICLVHYSGQPAQPAEFARLADRHGLTLIEDNAHGLGGRVGDQVLGTFGGLSTLSFHETKNVTCGEGGALVINDGLLQDRAEILREKGTDRAQFLRGSVDKYTWRDLGSSWVLSDLQAAVLSAQLEQFEAIQNDRIHIWGSYHRQLASWAEDIGATLPDSSMNTTSHLFFVLLPSGKARSQFINHMAASGVQVLTHYEPLHQSPFGSRYADIGSPLPVTEMVSERLVRLPMYRGMSDSDITHVVGAARQFSAAAD